MAHTRTSQINPSSEGSPPVSAVLLTVDEAAESLRVSRWTVYNLIRSNQLRTVKIGRRRLIEVAALNECVEALGEMAA